MPRLCPAKPKPWEISSRRIQPAYRRFWPMAVCVPIWRIGGGIISLGSKNYGYAGGVGKITDQNYTTATGEGTEWVSSDGDIAFLSDYFEGITFGNSARINAYPLTMFLRARWLTTEFLANHTMSVGNSGSGTSFKIGINTSGTAKIYVFRANTGSSDSMFGLNTVDTSRVYNVCVVFHSATLVELWIDGVLEATDTTSITFPSAVLDQFGIGCGNTSDGWSQAHIHVGYVWARALTGGEIVMLEADPFGPIRPFRAPQYKASAAANFRSRIAGGFVITG